MMALLCQSHPGPRGMILPEQVPTVFAARLGFLVLFAVGIYPALTIRRRDSKARDGRKFD